MLYCTLDICSDLEFVGKRLESWETNGDGAAMDSRQMVVVARLWEPSLEVSDVESDDQTMHAVVAVSSTSRSNL